MYFPQKTFVIINGDTPLEDTGDAALVKLAINYSKGLRPSYDTFGLCWIIW
jgi:hypothetical protein